MIPVDYHGKTIPEDLYNILVAHGEKLQEIGYRESFNKPNLFLKGISDNYKLGYIYADLRGRDIWDFRGCTEPMIYLYFHAPIDNWLKNKFFDVEIRLLKTFNIPFRFHLDLRTPFDNYNPSYTGICKLCNVMIKRDDFFCSKNCKILYESTLLKENPCKICGKPSTENHHTCYAKNITISVCAECHRRIHSKNEKYILYDIYKPIDKKSDVPKKEKRVKKISYPEFISYYEAPGVFHGSTRSDMRNRCETCVDYYECEIMNEIWKNCKYLNDKEIKK